MSFIGVVEPEQLTILTAVVDQHCLQAGIDLASPERQVVAQLVMAAGFFARTRAKPWRRDERPSPKTGTVSEKLQPTYGSFRPQ
jgi:hypothetical protein